MEASRVYAEECSGKILDKLGYTRTYRELSTFGLRVKRVKPSLGKFQGLSYFPNFFAWIVSLTIMLEPGGLI